MKTTEFEINWDKEIQNNGCSTASPLTAMEVSHALAYCMPACPEKLTQRESKREQRQTRH